MCFYCTVTVTAAHAVSSEASLINVISSPAAKSRIESNVVEAHRAVDDPMRFLE